MIELILLIAGFVGVIISAILTFKNKISYFKGICFGTLSQLTAFVLSVSNSILMSGVNPIDEAINTTFSYVKSTVEMMNSEELAAMFGGAMKVDVLSMIEGLRQVYVILFPAIIIISNAVAVLGLFIVIRAVLKLMQKDVSFIPLFSEIHLTKGLLLGGIFTVIMAYMLTGTVCGNAFSNIQLLFIAYAVLCGMSLIDYWLSKKIRNGLIRFIIYVLLGGFFGMVIYFGIFAAVIDAFKNFRKKSKEI